MRRLLWMAAALAFAAAPRLAPAAPPAADQPAESGAASGSFAGTYTQTRRGASATQTLALVLRRNQTCTLTTTSLDRTGRPVVEQGTWSSDDQSVTVVLTDTNGQQERNEITFEPRGDRLVATRYDRGRYGSEGLTLERKRAAPRNPPRVPVEGTYTES
jgi:NlpE N-terminal domain